MTMGKWARGHMGKVSDPGSSPAANLNKLIKEFTGCSQATTLYLEGFILGDARGQVRNPPTMEG